MVSQSGEGCRLLQTRSTKSTVHCCRRRHNSNSRKRIDRFLESGTAKFRTNSEFWKEKKGKLENKFKTRDECFINKYGKSEVQWILVCITCVYVFIYIILNTQKFIKKYITLIIDWLWKLVYLRVFSKI